MNKKVRRKYTADFKKEAVQLAENIGASQACRRLEICENNLHRWKKGIKNLGIEQSQDVLKLQLEVRRLKKELSEEKAIVEMLKKQQLFFQRRPSNDL